MKKKIFVFLFDGFSDWEISYLTPEINKSEQFDLVYFSKDGNQVTSMGGLQITPTTSLNGLKFEDIETYINNSEAGKFFESIAHNLSSFGKDLIFSPPNVLPFFE